MFERFACDRRHFLATGAVALASPALLGMKAAPGSAAVEIESGKLLGEAVGGALSFKGIPYAADTSGPNRFMPPRAMTPWSGVREAFRFGDRSIQAGRFGQPLKRRAEAGAPPESENCCVLNVYTRDLDSKARRPVMVWFHGGGYRAGSADTPATDGINLARYDEVVVVTVNHRLNLFGYLGLGHLDPDFADAANVGMLDLIAALKWVRANITAFGGDPENVTIFGQSGGGSKVATLMIMPAASGLFHRAINMSGPTFVAMDAAKNWEPLTDRFMVELGLAPRDVKALQQLPPEQLLAAHGRAVQALKTDDFRPVIDGRNIPHGPLTEAAISMNSHIPLMVGTTDTEASLFLRADPRNTAVTEAQITARIMAQFGLGEANTQHIIAAYRQDMQNRTPWEVLLSLCSDTMFRGRMLQATETMSSFRKAPVYLYNFGWKLPADGGVWGSPHAVDIPFAFRNVDKIRSAAGPGPVPDEVSLNMSSAFVTFAKSGNPNNARMPEWKRFNAKSRPTMVIDDKCKMVDDFRRAGRLASLQLLEQDAFQLETGPLFDFDASPTV